MTTGKNKLERYETVEWDDVGGTPRDLTGDLVPGSLKIGGLSFESVIMHGVGETVKNGLAGFAESPAEAKFYMNDTATTGAHTVLAATNGKTGTLTAKFGSGAAPAAGDQKWSGEYVLLEAKLELDGGKLVLACKWMPTGSIAPAFSTI